MKDMTNIMWRMPKNIMCIIIFKLNWNIEKTGLFLKLSLSLTAFELQGKNTWGRIIATLGTMGEKQMNKKFFFQQIIFDIRCPLKKSKSFQSGQPLRK